MKPLLKFVWITWSIYQAFYLCGICIKFGDWYADNHISTPIWVAALTCTLMFLSVIFSGFTLVGGFVVIDDKEMLTIVGHIILCLFTILILSGLLLKLHEDQPKTAHVTVPITVRVGTAPDYDLVATTSKRYACSIRGDYYDCQVSYYASYNRYITVLKSEYKLLSHFPIYYPAGRPPSYTPGTYTVYDHMDTQGTSTPITTATYYDGFSKEEAMKFALQIIRKYSK